MDQTSSGFDSVVEELQWLEIQTGFPEVLQQELRFLKMFMVCLTKFEEAGKDNHLANAVASLEAGLSILMRENEGEDSESGSRILLKNFEQLKPEMTNKCGVLLDSFRSISCSSNEILELVDCVVGNFQDLAILKADVLDSVKHRILLLGRKLCFLKALIPKRCIEHHHSGLEYVLNYVKGLVHDAANLSLLCLLKDKDEMMTKGLHAVFLDMWHMFIPGNAEVKEMFRGFYLATSSHKFEAGQIATSLVDLLLEGSADHFNDHVEMLRDGLIVIVSFCLDPVDEKDKALTNGGDGQIEEAINEVLSLILSIHLDESKVDVFSFLKAIEKVKVEIRRVYVPMLNPLDFNFPMTNAIGYINFLLENLKDMVNCNPHRIVFTKHQVMMILDQIHSLKPSLEIVTELQKVRKDLNEFLKQFINTMFLADHVISSCLLIDHPIWYDMLRLSDIIEGIKFIQKEVQRYSDHMLNARMSSTEMDSSPIQVRQANTSNIEGPVVGRKDELEMIIEKLKRGTAQLDIVSIVGMPGLGKTTIAKKVYNDPSIKYYFHIRAWCCLSQIYRLRELYFDILSDVTGVDDHRSYSNNTDDDLAEKLRKCLKGRKYLIVVDDIWNVEPWDRMKYSFPDDNNGSRIVFTTRIHNLVSQAKLNCSPHPLRSLSNEESWGLLQGKLFHGHSFPLDDELTEIGKNIAKNCNGLPLAVVLIAGILVGKDKEFWQHTEYHTSSQIVSEGCMDVLELSYNHLPDNLKPCFLYFGAFEEDKVVRAQKLMSLWIAEGLIPRTSEKSSYEVAEDYLSDLISRNLVILKERSSIGGIKSCGVHDLLHNLCLVKSREANFLHRVQDSDVSQSSSSPKKFDNYRLFIHAGWSKFVDTKPAGPFVHSLVLYGDQTESDKLSRAIMVFNSFNHLNVLDLGLIYMFGGFPQQVTLMVHLRYLSILCSGRELPESFVNLCNLETLVFPRMMVGLPEFFWKMKSLRHVHIGELGLDGVEDHEYGQLENLEILSKPFFVLTNRWKELLRRLPRLRKLKFTLDPFGSKFPELGSLLTHLESLTVVSGARVKGRLAKYKFPAFDFPVSLRKLTLKGLKVQWSLISEIGQLPNLEVLKLNWYAFKGSKWDVEDGRFLKLKHLELNVLDLEQWTVQDEPFPRLERLIVSNCEKLRGIPSSFGDIPTLEKIDMYQCPRASRSAWKIFMEQRDVGNDVFELDIDVAYNDSDGDDEVSTDYG
ncbi:OLC1v1012299C1 [Oldenlandia corymbosa var. corymbosa]|uniref:OLC1v1012299C1 n=1 Tax=Oldenlandia corymbosa var. corymbosa TaxID=529605 RepID=A0AAV1DZ02_OLDCO|nr:OLC1v1012299C1 [Oldenlandia corymbosa var. corymbosa]